MSKAAHTASAQDTRPLIVHVLYRFGIGGLENGVVNLINRLPAEAFRHAVVALTEVTSFRERVRRDEVLFFELHKGPGHGVRLYPTLTRLFRELGPAIVHTRNLAALEAVVPAWLAGVPCRVHGEHGRDITDLDGSNRTYRWVRKLYKPFVSRYVALSKDLEAYLHDAVAVPAERIAQIYNGVDTVRFAPHQGRRAPIEGCPFSDLNLWLVGTVGRMDSVKDQKTLAEAFVRAYQSDAGAKRMRLVMVGDGPLKAQVERVLRAAGLRDLAWLPGERDDVPAILRGLDCFVLPSLAEGISNTILEAMACGLPVIATRVGGNAELVEDGKTGQLVPAADSAFLADVMLAYCKDESRARKHGLAGRQAVLQRFSLERMVAAYQALYDGLLRRANAVPARAGAGD